MKSKKHKTGLNSEQKAHLKFLHVAQLGLEIGLVTFITMVLTVGISAVLPAYGVVALLLMLLSGLVIFVFGILISSSVSNLRKLKQPLPSLRRTPRNWIIATWASLAITILLPFVNPLFNDQTFYPERAVVLGLSIAALLVSCIGTLISTHLLWKRFNKRTTGISPRIFAYGSLGLVLLLTALLGSYNTSEPIKFKQITSSDAHLELGQSEIRQSGKDGAKEIKRNLLLGFEISSDQTDPIDEITAKGTKRYQYMHCSDGSYRYYTSEQFKDPNVGFTHQSPDYCAQNGAGTQIAISDTPPAEKIVQQVPVYRAPTYHSTTCTPSYYGSSVTCSGYY